MSIFIPRATNIYPLKYPLALPVNTMLPVITGTAQNGQILTGSNGTWTGTPTFTYKWLRNGIVISGATATTYTLTNSDIDTTITFEVTATNAAGSVVATSLGVIITNTLLSSLISYWKMDESSAGVAPVTRVDSVVASANNLTDTNNVASGTGILGNGAVLVAALSKTLSIASNALMQTGDIDFLFAGWFNPALLPSGAETIFAKSTNLSAAANLEYALFINASNTLTFRISNGSILTSVTDPTVLTTLTWYFVVCWHDSVNNNINIQLNNGTPTVVSVSTGVAAAASSFKFGNDGAAKFVTATVDEWGFWKRILTAGEKTLLYNAGVGLTYPF